MASSPAGNPVAQANRSESDSTSAITKSWFWSGRQGSSVYQLGNYDIVARLGQGGMGKVFKARHRNLKRYVALKTLRTDVDLSDETIVRFYREMEAIGRINHPNVVTATDAGPVEGVDCLIMEYLEGVDLSSLLKKVNRLPLAVSCEVIRQAAEGLTAIAAHGLVHRDMKPSNLFLCRHGQLKILDLGLARLGVDDDFTRRGEVYGTADYIAPEVAMGLGEYDAEADVYSLGCAFYKILCGQAPFETAEYDTFISKMHAHSLVAPVPISTLVPEVPGPIADLLDSMLAKEPDQRPTASEVAATLANFVEQDTPAHLLTLAAQHALVAEPIDSTDSATPLRKSIADTKKNHSATVTILGLPLQSGAIVAASLLLLLVLAPLAIWASGYSWAGTPSSHPEVAGEPVTPAEILAGEAPQPAEPLAAPGALGNPAVHEGTAGRDAPLEKLVWTGSSEFSFLKISDDRHSLTMQTNGSSLLALGSTGAGEHRFSAEVQQLDIKSSGWGVFYSYQLPERGRRMRYERVGCVYFEKKDIFYLVRSQFRHERGSPDFYQDQVAEAVVDIQPRGNTLEVTWHDHRLKEVRLNGEPVPELIRSTDYPPEEGSAKFGVYCSNTNAVFHLPEINGEVLQLKKADCCP